MFRPGATSGPTDRPQRGFALEGALARSAGKLADGWPHTCSSATWLLEVVVDGSLSGGAQLAVDTMLVSALKGKGELGGVLHNGTEWLWQAANCVKERTHPELVFLGRRARLVVVALDQIFTLLLAKTRVRSEPRLLQRCLEQALRWFAIISCAAARSFAASLLGLRGLMVRCPLTRGGAGLCGGSQCMRWQCVLGVVSCCV